MTLQGILVADGVIMSAAASSIALVVNGPLLIIFYMFYYVKCMKYLSKFVIHSIIFGYNHSENQFWGIISRGLLLEDPTLKTIVLDNMP